MTMSDAEFRSALVRLRQKTDQFGAREARLDLITQAGACMAGRPTMLTRQAIERRLHEELEGD